MRDTPAHSILNLQWSVPLLLLILEIQRNAVDAVSLVSRIREALAFENVSQMATTAQCQRNLKMTSMPTHQLVHTISVRVEKSDRSSCRVTAPGTVSKNAGQPHPESNF